MMRFCFSERDSENIDPETDEKNTIRGKKNKESNFYVPIEHKDDVEKMKVNKNLFCPILFFIITTKFMM